MSGIHEIKIDGYRIGARLTGGGHAHTEGTGLDSAIPARGRGTGKIGWPFALPANDLCKEAEKVVDGHLASWRL